MSYVFFEDVLEELGHKLTYDAVVNYAGNSFCDKSWDMITENNPFNYKDDGTKISSSNSKALLNLFEGSKVKVKKGVRK